MQMATHLKLRPRIRKYKEKLKYEKITLIRGQQTQKLLCQLINQVRYESVLRGRNPCSQWVLQITELTCAFYMGQHQPLSTFEKRRNAAPESFNELVLPQWSILQAASRPKHQVSCSFAKKRNTLRASLHVPMRLTQAFTVDWSYGNISSHLGLRQQK